MKQFNILIVALLAVFSTNLTNLKYFAKNTNANISHDSLEKRFVSVDAIESADINHRMEILNYIQTFWKFCAEKDINELEKIILNDVFFIQVSDTKEQSISDKLEIPKGRLTRETEDKKLFIDCLRSSIIKWNKNVEAKIDSTSIMSCLRGDENVFYGVNYHLNWASTTDHDTSTPAGCYTFYDGGWAFLLWEFFHDGTPPVIHFWIWQPDELISKGVPLIDMFDFKVQ